MKVAAVYDMDACRGPTGVTRHAMAQIRGLATSADVELQAISGRISEPDGRIFLGVAGSHDPSRASPLHTQHASWLANHKLGRLWSFGQDR